MSETPDWTLELVGRYPKSSRNYFLKEYSTEAINEEREARKALVRIEKTISHFLAGALIPIILVTGVFLWNPSLRVSAVGFFLLPTVVVVTLKVLGSREKALKKRIEELFKQRIFEMKSYHKQSKLDGDTPSTNGQAVYYSLHSVFQEIDYDSLKKIHLTLEETLAIEHLHQMNEKLYKAYEIADGELPATALDLISKLEEDSLKSQEVVKRLTERIEKEYLVRSKESNSTIVGIREAKIVELLSKSENIDYQPNRDLTLIEVPQAR